MDLMDEARQDLREERVQRLFFRYGKLFLMVTFLFIALSVVHLWWKEYQFNKNAQSGAQYMVALMKFQAQQTSEGVQILEELANKGEGSYSAIATLNLASSSSSKKEYDKAVHYYKMVAENTNYEALYRDFAQQMLISAKLNQGVIDHKGAIQEFEQYIAHKPIFMHSAQENLAALYLAENNKEKARELLNLIITSTAASKQSRLSAEQLLLLAD